MVIFGMDYYVQACNALDLILIFALTHSAMSFKNILGTCFRSQVSTCDLLWKVCRANFGNQLLCLSRKSKAKLIWELSLIIWMEEFRGEKLSKDLITLCVPSPCMFSMTNY